MNTWLGTFELWGDQEFAKILSEGLGRRVYDCCGMPLYVSYRPFAGATSAYLYCPSANGPWQNDLVRIAKKLGIARIQIYSAKHLGVLDNASKKETATCVLPLSEGEECLWKRVGDKTRNMVRKGLRNGVVAKFVDDSASFDAWWKIYETKAIKREFALQPRRLVHALFKNRRLSRLCVAKIEERVVGGCFFLCGNYPMYWLGAFDSVYRSLAPGHLTMWEAMRRFIEEGYFIMDMGGISSAVDDGPTRFKKSFHGEVLIAYKYSMVTSRFKTWLLNKFGGEVCA